MSIAEKLVTLAENEEKVYKAGQLSVLTSSKALKGSEQGSSIIITDISPIEHNVCVSVRVRPPFTGLLMDCTFEDTGFGYIRSTPFTVSKSGDYTIALSLADNSKWTDWVVAWPGWAADDSPPYNGSLNPSEGEWLSLSKGEVYRLFLGSYRGLKAADILSGTIEMGDNVTAPPISEGSVEGVKVSVGGGNAEATEYISNADGKVEGVKSIYPTMVISADTPGLILTAEYIKDIDKAMGV